MPPGDQTGDAAPPVGVVSEFFDVLVRLIETAVLAGACTLLPMAMLGWFRPTVVLPLLTACGVGFWILIGRSTDARLPTAPVVLVLTLVVLLVGLNGRHSSQHFAVNRDPGLYTVLGTWIADEGDLLIEGNEPQWEGLPGRRDAGAAFYDLDRSDGRLYAQFSHLVPSTLALAEWVGGLRLLTRLNALIAGAGLLVFFAAAGRVMRPWAAALATAGLGVNLVHAHVSRDTFSEPLAQLLVLIAILELSRAWSTGSSRHAAMGGLALAAVWSTRIDGVLLVSTAGAVLAIWLTALAAGSPIVDRRGIGAFLGAWAAMTTVAWLDLAWFTPRYLADLWSQTSQGLLLGATAFLAAPVLAMGRPLMAPVVDRWRRTSHRTEALVAAGLVVVLWIVRPLLTEVHGPGNALIPGLQARDGLTIEPTRTYAEHSVWWFSYYFGPWVLAGAIAGLYWAIRRVLNQRNDRLSPILLCLGPITLVYLVKPSISPDQVWAMRRFFPTGLPLLALLFGLAVDTVWTAAGRHRVRLAIPALSAITLIGLPLSQIAPLRTMRTMRVGISEIGELCEAIGPDAAVVLSTESQIASNLTQSVRSVCDVPATGGSPVPSPALDEVARAWAEEGRQLILITGSLEPDQIPGELRATVPVSVRNLERAVGRAPETIQGGYTEYWVIGY
ncbi:MAG: hypothetical protein GY925_06670 [Actinomycetia bacterium]|nr:hypothetical protein [Actinomycetes bacterium]